MIVADSPLILGIETSCDETAAAVVAGCRRVLSSIVASQHDLHAEYAGVVPEIASRAHLERIVPVIRAALAEAGLALGDLQAVAVGHRPGLIGSLLVGVSAAKALAWSLGVPIIGVDHVLAHLHSCALDDEAIEYPALGLVVSGGHTSLFLVDGPLDVQLLGRTIDDAAGEAYDKAATILELGYPGGPALDQLAQRGDERAFDFPMASLGGDELNFSFSGLKTALLYAVCGQPVGRGAAAHFERDASMLDAARKADLAASFQRAAVGALLRNVSRALDRHDVSCLLVGGGVSANTRLRADLAELSRRRKIRVRLPRPEYCLDNAAMIAALAAAHVAAGRFDDWSLGADSVSMILS